MLAFLWLQTSSFWREEAETRWEVKVSRIRIRHLLPGRLPSGFSITWHSLLLRRKVQRRSAGSWEHIQHASPARCSSIRHARSHAFFVVPLKVTGPGPPSHHVYNHHLRMGCSVSCPRKQTLKKDVNSNSVSLPLTLPWSCFSPSRSKHHWLKSAGAALILLEACELFVSFSLGSLKGSLSFPLCFHWLLPPSSAAGRITARYLQFKCIWEGVARAVAASSTPPQQSEKSYLHVGGGRSPTEAVRTHSPANGIQFFLEFLFSNPLMNAALEALWEELVSVWVTPPKLCHQQSWIHNEP